ncbi:glycosyltransferase family 22 protein [Calocera cornea HHB12733]|uniref:Mannosyltransferase n=1 Tax=Calocera cornea HHB12733 TaxID=1353952 RepID=A0A165G761_9BASI|nr:glycosyltransferase family 22 protein [Calocera cornea HHB12733]
MPGPPESLFDFIFFLVAGIHLFLAPFTKVEESFNLHATHDVFMYGVLPEGLKHYDHFDFPGVVPRSFIGSLLLGGALYPAAIVGNALGLLHSKLGVQILARLLLAAVNVTTLCILRRATSRRFGRTSGLMFTVLSCSQFHVPFWLSRTLPNMFAFPLVNIASTLLLEKGENPSARKAPTGNYETALALIVVAATIFRAELVLLLPGLLIEGLWRGVSPPRIILTGAISGVVALAATVTVDSYFWQQWPMWPEFQGIWFNVYEGKSEDWGVSPMHAYFSEHLPKLLLGSLPLSLIGLADTGVISLLQPWIAYLSLISLLGHKEWRFIVYAVPIFNIAAARGAQIMLRSARSGILSVVARLALVGLVLGNLLATGLLTYLSSVNYPGGNAMLALHAALPAVSKVHVHIDNLAAQTGASLFTQLYGEPSGILPHPLVPWEYNKTEVVVDYAPFSHVITERPASALPGNWAEVASVRALAGVQVPRPGKLLEMGTWRELPRTLVRLEPRLWILQNRW